MAKAFETEFTERERAEYAARCEEWVRLALDCAKADREACMDTAMDLACICTGQPIDWPVEVPLMCPARPVEVPLEVLS